MTESSAEYLSVLAKASHIQGGGARCPCCHSDHIDGDRLEHDGDGGVTQTVECAKCNSSWTDVYRLVDVKGISA